MQPFLKLRRLRKEVKLKKKEKKKGGEFSLQTVTLRTKN